jgi:hypothetical protein
VTEKYFAPDRTGKKVDLTNALGACSRSLYGRLAQTTCWGLAALQAMTWGDRFDTLPEASLLRGRPRLNEGSARRGPARLLTIAPFLA